jgi:hypothetical protein
MDGNAYLLFLFVVIHFSCILCLSVLLVTNKLPYEKCFRQNYKTLPINNFQNIVWDL